MKKTRKLIPAIAMLLTSAVMVSTSSYAWFSMNSEVTAGNMTIKATTDANLYIKEGASVDINNITGTTATLTAKNEAILPADMSNSSGTVTVRIPATYTTEPTVSTPGVVDTWETIGTLTATENKDAQTGGKDVDTYCVNEFVTIARKATNAGTYSLTPKCTVTVGSGTSALNRALRVGLIINGAYHESGDMNTETGSIEFTFNAITGLNDNTAYSACLMFWFEGEDSDCYVNNAVNLTSNVAAWTFTSAGA